MLKMKKIERPLSPHLQVYTPLINMVMSIVHRITGSLLYFGTAILMAWLLCIASGEAVYNTFQAISNSFIGKIVIISYTWALIHHMLGGIRHLIWDTGSGFEIDNINRLSWGTLIGSVLLTIIFWILNYTLS
jgi:succinate dehydrogenase / fumarate reductase, cytochrome b subunit